jgi:hypothetical protein
MTAKPAIFWGWATWPISRCGNQRQESACLSKAFVDDLKSRTVMQIVQNVDKFYQENSGTLYTLVIEVVLRRCANEYLPDTVRRK